MDKQAGAKTEFDELDFRLLSALSANSRLSLRKLAQKVDASPGTVMHRLKKLEASRAIRKYSVLVDYDVLGFDLSAIIKINVAKGKLFEVEKKIATHPNVCSVFDVTGISDIVVVARFKTRASLDAFLKKIQTFDFVKRTETAIILNTIKEDTVNF
ncbi:MAG: Lrp/AsnC family transcriptional regulator [archaeon]|nr:Lrp/AsnC family transcriptional regulator [archaeon]